MLYNESQYNEQPYQYFQLSEVLSLADNIAKDATKVLTDSIFLSDLLTKQVTSKILSENLSFNDWTSVKKTNSEFFDQ